MVVRRRGVGIGDLLREDLLQISIVDGLAADVWKRGDDVTGGPHGLLLIESGHGALIIKPLQVILAFVRSQNAVEIGRLDGWIELIEEKRSGLARSINAVSCARLSRDWITRDQFREAELGSARIELLGDNHVPQGFVSFGIGVQTVELCHTVDDTSIVTVHRGESVNDCLGAQEEGKVCFNLLHKRGTSRRSIRQ